MPHAINISKVGGLDCGDHSRRFLVWVGEIDAEELLVAQGLSGRRGRCYEGIVGGSQQSPRSRSERRGFLGTASGRTEPWRGEIGYAPRLRIVYRDIWMYQAITTEL